MVTAATGAAPGGASRTLSLQRVFEKTGTRRQSQLVRLLLSYGTLPACPDGVPLAGTAFAQGNGALQR